MRCGVQQRAPRRREGQARVREIVAGCANPELKALVVEASRALARLDTAHLAELALSCEALSASLASENTNATTRKVLAREAREAVADMEVFGRILEATRANLKVMNRLRQIRMGQLEYTVEQAGSRAAKADVAESADGNR
jgi:hypothetical protein